MSDGCERSKSWRRMSRIGWQRYDRSSSVRAARGQKRKLRCARCWESPTSSRNCINADVTTEDCPRHGTCVCCWHTFLRRDDLQCPLVPVSVPASTPSLRPARHGCLWHRLHRCASGQSPGGLVPLAAATVECSAGKSLTLLWARTSRSRRTASGADTRARAGRSL